MSRICKDLTVNGNLDVQGAVASIDSTDVSMGSRYLYLNKNYTTSTPVQGGIVMNYNPTTTQELVSGSAFTGTTVDVVDGDVFGSGDIIQITGANDITNNGIFLINDVTDDTITIDTSPISIPLM